MTEVARNSSTGRLVDGDMDGPDSPGSLIHRLHDGVMRAIRPGSYASIHSDDIEMNMTSSDVGGSPTTGLVGFGTSADNMDVKYKPYMTIVPSESEDVILDSLRSQWALKLPRLLICILGGKDSDMKYDLEKVICKGLVQTVLSTDVWLFTSGLQRGLIKSIGEALAEHATGRAIIKNRDLVAVGVAPLGILKQKEKFRQQHNKQCIPVIQLDYSAQGSSLKLEPNHTHFILVDDKGQERGIEAKARNRLINKISTMKIEGTHDSNARIPAVYLLIGGDVTVFDTLEDATEHNIPIVVFHKTQGAAFVLDEISFLQKEHHDSDHDFDKEAIQCIREEFQLSSQAARPIKEQIERLIEKKHLITFVSDANNIDGTILDALMEANSEGQQSNDQMLMSLAVIWDRIYLAKSVFERTTSKIWQDTSFVKELLHLTLVEDQHDFVKFFIEAGRVDMQDFLSFDELRKLYGELSKDSVVSTMLRRFKKKRVNRFSRSAELCSVSDDQPEICLGDVGCLLQELICDGYDTDYLSCSTHYKAKKKKEKTFEDPYKELFLWAVLQDRIRLAKLFWKLGKPSVGGALVASKLLKALSNQQEVTDAQKAANMYQHAKEFQHIAVDILNMCYEEDRRRTSDLLVRIMPEWGGATCLDIAAAAISKDFISQAAVQNLLSELWMGRLAVMTHELKIGLCVILPLLSIWLITFTDDKDDSTDALKKKRNSVCLRGSVGTLNKRESAIRQHMLQASPLKEGWDPLSWLHRLKMFLEAPVVRFSYNVISQVLFLLLFSYIMLTNFHQEVSGCEIVLMVWVFTLFTDEIRQILQEKHKLLLHRFQAWLWGYWNSVDLISLVLFAVGVGLRFHPATFDAARIVLALDLMVFYFRILHICSASKLLGPKLIMITKMLLDLTSFVCILAVFLIGYGVACQAILYPNSTHPASIARGVLYRSYFQLYGQLFLEDVDSDCAANQTQIAEGMDSCPQSSWFATISLAVYLFISNILLLNLLIAMLNYTFTAIQENTDAYWKYQRYQLIKEYYRRPPIVSPFILAAHLYQLVRYVWDRYFPECKMYRAPNLIRKKMEAREAAEMTAWEKVNCRDYLAEKKKAESEATNVKLEQMQKKLRDLSDTIYDYFDDGRLNRSFENVIKKHVGNDTGHRLSRSQDQVSFEYPDERHESYEARSPRVSPSKFRDPSSTSTPKKRTLPK
ncbi:transient receptor potential cation channel subfamily M member 5-like isoform X1 [Patiria miniata]|uniref:Uncharacterized protein n=2 Tax=Patiria miniata TaxID=46514 RepID=A0A914BLF7_PATMI|nr:transient receptor potential cation channel subfamily M member 5-like isoform X1 [Patiria miniata]